jgi:hypothetical protein
MTQEEKKLLLKDLSARLPYGVIVETYWEFENKKEKTFPKTILTYGMLGYYIGEDKWKYNTHFLPFLRPMSSMTEEEKEEFHKLKQFSVTVVMPNGVSLLKPTYIVDLEDDGDGMNYLYDWLNAHHFDYRGLIEKGIAIEAPKGMYKK